MNLKNFIMYILLIIIIIGVVFSASSQTYEQQSLVSSLDTILKNEPLRAIIAPIKFSYAGRVISVETVGYVKFVEFIIRKSAHFFIFLILAFFTIRALYYFTQKIWTSALFTLLFIFIFAASDEFHQKLTGGRTPLIQDVLLDTAGGAVAIVCFIIWHQTRKKPMT